ARAASNCIAAVGKGTATSYAASNAPFSYSNSAGCAAAAADVARTTSATRNRRVGGEALCAPDRASERERHAQANLRVVTPIAIRAPVATVEDGGFDRAGEPVGEGA